MKKPNQAQKMSDLAPVRWILASLGLHNFSVMCHTYRSFNQDASARATHLKAATGRFLEATEERK